MFVSNVLENILEFAADNLTVSLVLLLTLLYVGSEFWPGLGRNLPPAPWQFPVLGFLPFLPFGVDRFFNRMRKTLGDVYRLTAGGQQMIIVLGSFKAIKEALITNGEIFSGRVQQFAVERYFLSNAGIIVEDGWAWKEQRRFALSTLRDFGFGRFTMEEKIIQEADRLTKVLKDSKGSPINLKPFLYNSAANVICSLTFGKSFEYDDPEFAAIRETVVEQEKRMILPVVAILPWTRHVSEYLSGMTLLKRFKTEIDEFLMKYIVQHQKTFDDKALRDYLDCYLAEMYRRQKNNPKDVGSFDEIRLRSNLFLMFFAGVSTTSNTLNWAFRMLVAHPEMQEELHEEIDRVVGTDRQMSYADRTQMPRAEAFLSEIQRYADVVPLGVPHATLDATKLFGYDIPKRTAIVTNLRSAHQDPALWGDPENFRPSRFINEQGMMVRPEYLIPFGAGKRICMGEVLARTELFMLLTSLLQRFTFKLPAGIDPTVTGVSALTRQLPEYEMIVTART